jgi:hypothetical protein
VTKTNDRPDLWSEGAPDIDKTVTTDRLIVGRNVTLTLSAGAASLQTQVSCPQSHCSVTASNGGRSSSSGLTSLQVDDHLTPVSYPHCRLSTASNWTHWLTGSFIKPRHEPNKTPPPMASLPACPFPRDCPRSVACLRAAA